ncbi:phosphate ABC transporter permease subunit PstC [Marinobacter sp. EVN1]|uniref:phosphate ABC transporter permease subunit PstC n=1 Tax=Marinobacter sp. EVN1 TaxID=1397532 RepID=UPI0004CEE176|nr:phosphate ABC transporter permease subunit PstC [Marinobacter sp. EVN1]
MAVTSLRSGRRLLLDSATKALFQLLTWVGIAIFVGLALVLTQQSLPVLAENNVADILFSGTWDPEAGQFGFLPAIVGTLITMSVSMILVVPIAVLASVYIAEYARGSVRTLLSSSVDILAAVPSVIFGLFGLLIVAPLVDDVIAPLFGASSTGLGLLTASLVIAVMTLPIIMSLSVESLVALPDSLRETALSLGETRSGMAIRILLRAAGPGILSAILLGLGRAFEASIAVAMVIGGKNLIPDSLFDAGQTLPTLIVNTFGEMMSLPETRSALLFAALVLFLVVTAFNLLASFARNRLERHWRYQ